jgi:alkylated DNA repair dioxygenase AlkB
MNQLSLFNSPANQISNQEQQHKTVNNILLLESSIEGLQYIPNYISSEEQSKLLQSVNSEKWLGDLKRRVQHYGFKYDYKARFIDYSMRIGNLPSWATPFAKQLKRDNYAPEIPDQLIVNEYEPGQGIASHIDCQPCFGNTIISISLGSACIMNFINKYTKEKIEVFLEPRSLVVLKEEARYTWTHGIIGRKTDVFNGKKYEREVRTSLTFRKTILK